MAESDQPKKKRWVEMSEGEIRDEINLTRQFATAEKKRFDEYWATLSPRSRLILEAIASDRAAKTFHHSRRDLELYVSLHGENREIPTELSSGRTSALIRR